MNKKTMKLISIITIVLCVVMSVSTCFADVDINTMDDKTLEDSSSLANVGGTIMAIIRNVGIIVAVIILMVLGIKYMIGSAEEKAEYKKTMIPYLVGAVLLFGAAAISQAVISLSQSITTT